MSLQLAGRSERSPSGQDLSCATELPHGDVGKPDPRQAIAAASLATATFGPI
jgi:hypothetical protein